MCWNGEDLESYRLFKPRLHSASPLHLELDLLCQSRAPMLAGIRLEEEEDYASPCA